MATKRCPQCKEVKERDAFSVATLRYDKVQGICRQCASVYRKANKAKLNILRRNWRKVNEEREKSKREKYHKENKEKIANTLRRRRWRVSYRMSEQDFRDMDRKQGGICAICGSYDSRKRLRIDHCHKTGAVRALLCRACNLAEGLLGGSAERARALAAYIEQDRR